MTVARFSAQPADTGLYRREHEHDACGVALVATMRGTAGHDIVVHALDALRNLDHRGATGADPLVGDGAGILTQVPDAFFRAVLDADLPPGGCVRRRHGLPARRRRRAPRGRDPHRGHRRERGPAGHRLARRARHPRPRRPHRPRVHAVLPPALRRLRQRPDRHRARPGRLLPAQACRARGRGLLPVAVGPHRRLQGHAHHRPARAVLPRPVRRAVRLRAGAGALPLLDQHLPELAAGPPVPADRAQRRDQHRQGQPQLDARAREPDQLRPLPRRPRPGPSRSAPRGPPTRRPSTRCSSCCTSAAGRCRTRC